MWIRRAKDLAREFQSGLEDMGREAELDKLTEEFRAELDPDGLMDTVKQDIENTIDSDHSVRDAMEVDHVSHPYTAYEFDTANELEADEKSIIDPGIPANPSQDLPTERAAATDDDAQPAKPES